MEKDESFNELVNFFQVLADPNRLKIIGLLSQKNATVEQLTEMLKLRPSTVSHHLTRLAEAGLVSARAESYYNVYQFEFETLEQIARRLLSKETLPSLASGLDLDAYDRKVVSNYTLPDGRLKYIPVQRIKLEAILNYIIESFEPGTRITENQVNEILRGFHEDFAILRRELVAYRLLARDPDGSFYWRLG